MKKLYISPLVAFELLEDEELLIAESHTETTSMVIDPEDSGTDTPGFAGVGGYLPEDDGESDD